MRAISLGRRPVVYANMQMPEKPFQDAPDIRTCARRKAPCAEPQKIVDLSDFQITKPDAAIFQPEMKSAQFLPDLADARILYGPGFAEPFNISLKNVGQRRGGCVRFFFNNARFFQPLREFDNDSARFGQFAPIQKSGPVFGQNGLLSGQSEVRRKSSGRRFPH